MHFMEKPPTETGLSKLLIHLYLIQEHWIPGQLESLVIKKLKCHTIKGNHEKNDLFINASFIAG